MIGSLIIFLQSAKYLTFKEAFVRFTFSPKTHNLKFFKDGNDVNFFFNKSYEIYGLSLHNAAKSVVNLITVNINLTLASYKLV